MPDNNWVIEDSGPEQNSSPKIQENSQEGWGQFLARNVAKTPVLAYELARSGLGVGNLTELAARKLGAPEAVKKGLRYALPSTHQANEEASAILPKYLTEHKPEDYWAEFALTELPLILASGGASSVRNFGRAAATSGAILAGGKIGSTIGGEIGKQLGDEEVGSAIGGLGGGITGAIGSNKLLRPSKNLIPQVEKAERTAFETSKSKDLADLTKKADKVGGQLVQEQSAFDKFKQGKISTAKGDIDIYKNKLKEIEAERKPLYKQATELEKGIVGQPTKIQDVLKQSKKDLDKGLLTTDRNLLNENISSLRKFVDSKNGFSLTDAKKFQKNFNDQIYNRDASLSFKRSMSPIVESLNEFIESTGGPEHSQAWKQAEGLTQELKALQRGEKDFIKSKMNEIRDINKEKYPMEREHMLIKEHKDLQSNINDLGKQTYERMLKSDLTQNNIAESLKDINKDKSMTSKYGLPGLTAALGYYGFGKVGGALGYAVGQLAISAKNEYQIAQSVMKSHPEIFKQYNDAIRSVVVKNIPRAIKQLNAAGEKIEKLAPEQQELENSDWVIE